MSQLILNPRNVVDTTSDLVDRVDPTENLTGGIAENNTLFQTLGNSSIGDGGGASYVYRTTGRPATESSDVVFGPGADDYFKKISTNTNNETVEVITDDATITSNITLCDTTSNDIRALLPVAESGQKLTVKKDHPANTVIVDTRFDVGTNTDDKEVSASWSENGTTTEVEDVLINDHNGDPGSGVLFTRLTTSLGASSYFLSTDESLVSGVVSLECWIYRSAGTADSVHISMYRTVGGHKTESAEILNGSTASIAVVSGVARVTNLPEGYTKVRLNSTDEGINRIIVYPVSSSSGPSPGSNTLYGFQVIKETKIDGQGSKTLIVEDQAIVVVYADDTWQTVSELKSL
jgi:hypothetical protein